MKILNVKQIREADAYTIKHEPIESIALMERAAKKWTNYFLKSHPSKNKTKHIFCGPGNNGGDGLAIARRLLQKKHKVNIYALKSTNYSSEFLVNQQRLEHVRYIETNADFPVLKKNDIVIDALFGSGLNKPLSGVAKSLVAYINEQARKVVCVDIPSGLSADSLQNGIAIQAHQTYTFQFPKLAFMLPESGKYAGEFKVLNIGLHKSYIKNVKTSFYYLTKKEIKPLLKERTKFSHKGTYGHALLLAGSHGKMGAAVLCANACMRTGVGLMSAFIPSCGYSIFQVAALEAMCMTDKNELHLSEVSAPILYSAVGIGPGIGTHKDTIIALRNFLSQNKKPCLLDADALNILAAQKSLWKYVPHDTILTPHPKEIVRLAGTVSNDIERIEQLRKFSLKHKVITVLKGAHTAIADSNGNVYFNSTGNAGMATGGSGDVLSGVILSLLAQGYAPIDAAKTGVYLHGLAGDLALKKQSKESLIAGDLLKNIGRAFKQLTK